MKTVLFILFVFVLGLNLFGEIDWTENPIAEDILEPWQVFPVDMDYDNDMDVVCASRLTGDLYWFELLDYSIYVPHIVSYNSPFAIAVVALDIDEDDDIDIFCASQTNGLELWENNGDHDFSMQIIGSWPSPTYLDTCDVDLDGDVDILISCCENNSNRMGWVENLGDLNFTDHIVITNWIQANSVDAADIDNDGDIDLIGTASGREGGDGEISWFENIDNEFEIKHDIFVTAARPSCAKAVDLNEDGNMDIVASVCQLNQVIFFENDGDENFSYDPIGYNFNRALSVDIADFDDDGDIDVVAASINNDKVSWLENDGFEDFTEHIITNSLDGAGDVVAVDLDQDGDMDILASGQYTNRVVWFEAEILSHTEDDIIFPENLLLQNYPNPFNPDTIISFSVKQKSSFVTLNIYNIKGQLIRELANTQLPAGKQFILWDGADNIGNPMPSGVYLYQLNIQGQKSRIKKCLLMI